MEEVIHTCEDMGDLETPIPSAQCWCEPEIALENEFYLKMERKVIKII